MITALLFTTAFLRWHWTSSSFLLFCEEVNELKHFGERSDSDHLYWKQFNVEYFFGMVCFEFVSLSHYCYSLFLWLLVMVLNWVWWCCCRIERIQNMNTRVRTSLQSMKAPMKQEKVILKCFEVNFILLWVYVFWKTVFYCRCCNFQSMKCVIYSHLVGVTVFTWKYGFSWNSNLQKSCKSKIFLMRIWERCLFHGFISGQLNPCPHRVFPIKSVYSFHCLCSL